MAYCVCVCVCTGCTVHANRRQFAWVWAMRDACQLFICVRVCVCWTSDVRSNGMASICLIEIKENCAEVRVPISISRRRFALTDIRQCIRLMHTDIGSYIL